MIGKRRHRDGKEEYRVFETSCSASCHFPYRRRDPPVLRIVSERPVRSRNRSHLPSSILAPFAATWLLAFQHRSAGGLQTFAQGFGRQGMHDGGQQVSHAEGDIAG